MTKRFKSKSKKKKPNILFKMIFFFMVIGCSFLFSFHLLYEHLKNNITDEDIFQYLIETSTGTQGFLDFLNYDSTSFLLKYTLGIQKNDEMFLETDYQEVIGANYEYVEDPNPVKIDQPLVYIYNTHQTEGYQKNLQEHEITPTVMFGSYILREKLNNLQIPTIVETANITEILRANNWKYAYSYEASRLLIKDTKEKYPTLKYYIDFHRDSVSYEYTTTTINNEKYAKLMFVVGGKNEGYQANLNIANRLNEKLKAIDTSLSRGVIIKEGEGVNGIYNQDLDSNIVLIEVGGQYNDIVEVSNSLDILSKILHELIMEDKYG